MRFRCLIIIYYIRSYALILSSHNFKCWALALKTHIYFIIIKVIVKDLLMTWMLHMIYLKIWQNNKELLKFMSYVKYNSFYYTRRFIYFWNYSNSLKMKFQSMWGRLNLYQLYQHNELNINTWIVWNTKKKCITQKFNNFFFVEK